VCRLALELAGAPLDGLQATDQLFDARLHRGGGLDGVVRERLKRIHQLAHAFAGHVRHPHLERANALAQSIEILADGNGETAEKIVDLPAQSLLDGARDRAELLFEAARDVADAALHFVAKRLRLIEKNLTAAR